MTGSVRPGRRSWAQIGGASCVVWGAAGPSGRWAHWRLVATLTAYEVSCYRKLPPPTPTRAEREIWDAGPQPRAIKTGRRVAQTISATSMSTRSTTS